VLITKMGGCVRGTTFNRESRLFPGVRGSYTFCYTPCNSSSIRLRSGVMAILPEAVEGTDCSVEQFHARPKGHQGETEAQFRSTGRQSIEGRARRRQTPAPAG